MCSWGNAMAVAITVCLFVLPVLVSSQVSLTGNCSGNTLSEPLEIWGAKRDALSCTLLQSEEPVNLPLRVQGDFMGAPQYLEAVGDLLQDISGNLSPQVVITWEPPASAAGFNNLKGFYVEIYGGPRNPAFFRCYLFDFSQSNFTSEDHKLKFRKTLLGFKGGSQYSYVLKMYTLPMSPESKFKKQSFTLEPFQDGTSPGDWSAALTYERGNRMAPAQITIRFSLASKKYKFLTYIVKLVGDRDKRNAIHTCRISTQHTSECQGKTINPPTQNATSMSITFYDLQADTYKIKIQPDDPYWNTPGQCLCYQTPSNTSVRCVSCLVTSTRSITVAPQGAMLSTSSPSSAATDIFSQVGAAESTLSMTVITAVLAALGCVSVLTVGVALWRKKRANATRRLVYSGIPTSGGHDPGTHSQRGLFARKVYLVYAEDHKDHINVINSLATHLKKQCCCEVFYLRWFPQEIQTMGAYEWILSHIDQADFVIIINSEAAFKLFEARHTNVSLRRLDEGPEGDTFSLALTHVLTKSSEPWFFRKTILAYFDYTDDDFILKEICPGVQYRLPKHFKEFVCHIHEMSGQSNIGEMVDLHATSSGRQLLEAIRKAKHFQKSDPQWFHKRFSCEEDSGFDTISPTCDSTVGADDSVSIATRPLRGMHIHPSESDNADEFKSAVTYDTAYAKSHGEWLYDMIPPSEVSLGASTGSICRRIDNINKQNEINAGRFIPVPQTETDVKATSNSTYIRDPPVAASQGYSQSDSCVSMGGRDV